MNLRTFLLILLSVSLSACAQIALKTGMNSARIQEVLAGGRPAALLAVGGNPYVLLGLFMYALGAVFWLLVLARLDVSLAYPFVGLGFLLTMGLGYLLLDEPVGAMRLLGTLLVATGTILVARS